MNFIKNASLVMRKFVSILLISVITLVTGFICWFGYDLIYNAVIDHKAEQSVFLVKRDRAHGTGFVVEYKGKNYMITNKHVCIMLNYENPKTLTAEINGKDVVVKIKHISKTDDICVLEAPKDVPALKFADGYNKFDKVFAFGFPTEHKLTKTDGYVIGYLSLDVPFDIVTDSGRGMTSGQCVKYGLKIVEIDYYGNPVYLCIGHMEALSVSATIAPGNSGSPVLNRFGNVIGVAAAGSPSSNNYAMIVPLERVLKIMEKL